MKHRLQITLEDEANEILNQQENKSKYIEDLILKQDTSDLTAEIKRLSMLTDGLVNDTQNILGYIETLKMTIKQTIKQSMIDSSIASSRPTAYSTIQDYPKEFVPKPPDPVTGYPCCTKQTPCKHWAWDSMESCWKNTLTGVTKEA